MKTMKEIRDLNESELLKQIQEEKDLLATMTFQKTSGQVQKSSQFSLSRKQIAKMKTVLRERQLQQKSK
ncbi:MAG: 50S ribosomal protein L29 [Ignavibacteria bacterium]|nr:50S ribosomal protein L29 [Bacteroidota bacterium]MSQ46146.1 50S ribosomal protein L29 [Ignavibacteria bacterium]